MVDTCTKVIPNICKRYVKFFKILSFILFANDTNNFYSHSNLQVDLLVENINVELMHLSVWFRANKLSLNIDQTNFIIFGNKG